MAVATESELVEGIASYLSGAIPGLKGMAWPSPSIQAGNLPAVLPMVQVNFRSFWDTNPDMETKLLVRLLVLGSPGDGRSGAKALSAFTDTTGSKSIPAALNADPTMGGLVKDLNLIRLTGEPYERFDGDGNLVLYGRYLEMWVFA